MGKKGFTFIEVIIASMILMLLVGAVVHYHSSAGASKGQEYYLKAVQVARAELDKLKALFEFTTGSFDEFVDNVTAGGGLPADIYLFRYTGETTIEVPNPIFKVYYKDHNSIDPGNEFLKKLGDSPPYAVNTKNSVQDYHQYYEERYNLLSDDDYTDCKTFTYFTDDLDPSTTDEGSPDPKVDASIVVIDDMGSPEDPEDDLLGNIGWWVENVDPPNNNCKKITFVLQFWYPGQSFLIDPEVIVLKTTLVKN